MKPNVLFITCDQLRADALGCYGNEICRTPNIDRIAAAGARFTDCHTAYPVCAPNRATLATGRFPSVHGVATNGIPLADDETTVMEVARRAGYRTYGAGKMHFGPQWRFPPDGGVLNDPSHDLAVNPQPSNEDLPWHGFERVAITEDNRVGPYGDYLSEHGYDVWADPHSFTYPQHITKRSVYPEEHHQTTWVADRSIEFLRDHPADEPFFLWTSFVDPHHPFTPPAPYDTMYDPARMPLPARDEGEVPLWPDAYRSKHFATEGSHEAIGMHELADSEWQRITAFYYGMVTLIDTQIGRIMDAVRSMGQEEETIVVFTADHGEMLGDHGLVFKGTTYEQVTRMPLLVSPTGALRDAPRVVDELASAVDVPATILDLAGLARPAGMQGASLWALGAGEADGAGAAGGPAGGGARAHRDALLIENQGVRRSVRTKDYLFTWHGPGLRGELYDLHADPGCFRNLWDDPSSRELKANAHDALLDLMARNLDPSHQQTGAC